MASGTSIGTKRLGVELRKLSTIAPLVWLKAEVEVAISETPDVAQKVAFYAVIVGGGASNLR
jgi:hypothetical protein